jgi:hypothetical protein
LRGPEKRVGASYSELNFEGAKYKGILNVSQRWNLEKNNYYVNKKQQTFVYQVKKGQQPEIVLTTPTYEIRISKNLIFLQN